MSLRNEGTSAIAWSLIEKILKRGVQFILSIFLARLLTPSDFGVVAMATIFVSWAEVFSDFGMGQAIIQRKEVTDTQKSTVFYINLIMGVLIAIVFVFIAPWAARFYDNDIVAWVVRVSGLTFIIQSLNVVQSSLFKKALNFKVGTVASFISSTLSGIVGVVMAYLGFGVWSLLVQSVLSTAIITAYFWLKSEWRPMLAFDFKVTKPLFTKGLGFMGQGLIDNVFNSLGSMAIGKLFSPAILGLFSRGHSLATMPETTFISPITRPLFPIFAKVQDKKEDLQNFYIKIVEMLNWVMVLICGLCLLCSDEIILTLYGEQWAEASVYLFILSFMIPLVPNWTTTTALWKALGHVKKVVLVTFIEKALFFLSIAALFHSIKLYAVLFVTSYFIANIIKAIINSRITSMSFYIQYKEWLIDIAIMGIGVFLLSQFHSNSYLLALAVKGFSFCVYYITVGYIFKLSGMRECFVELGVLLNKVNKNMQGQL